jgi:SMC interacting uncharacterized protein involved in chromosome segregation
MTSHWIDPSFDPLQELKDTKDLTRRLVAGHNNHENALMQISQQQNEMVNLMKQMQHQIMQSRLEIEWLKLHDINKKQL